MSLIDLLQSFVLHVEHAVYLFEQAAGDRHFIGEWRVVVAPDHGPSHYRIVRTPAVPQLVEQAQEWDVAATAELVDVPFEQYGYDVVGEVPVADGFRAHNVAMSAGLWCTTVGGTMANNKDPGAMRRQLRELGIPNRSIKRMGWGAMRRMTMRLRTVRVRASARCELAIEPVSKTVVVRRCSPPSFWAEAFRVARQRAGL